jgi:type IX secretion system PorP/SprF family membrane protein
MNRQMNNYKKYIRFIAIILPLSITLPAWAQRTTLPAQYFFNPYISNAAMAGTDSSLNLMASYNRQAENVTGTPVNMTFAADYFMGKRVGLGVNVFNQKAGILNQTRAAISYAYHLPVGNNGQRLSFGISAAFINKSISLSHVEGDQGDPLLIDYSSKGIRMDGDLGMAYLSDNWNFQVALPSFRNVMTKNETYSIDRPSLYAAGSYHFRLNQEISSITPLIAYSQMKEYKDILDLGVSVKGLNDILSVMAIYHTTENVSAGVSVTIRSQIALMAAYTSHPKDMGPNANGRFSLNAKWTLFSR